MSNKKTNHSKKFDVPNIFHYKPLLNEDKSLLIKLSKSLEKVGILENKDPHVMRTEDSFQTILKEAQKGAVSEKDVNPGHYEPEAEGIVQSRENRLGDQFDNPSLDGRDDYEDQIYEDNSAPPKPSVVQEDRITWSQIESSRNNLLLSANSMEEPDPEHEKMKEYSNFLKNTRHSR